MSGLSMEEFVSKWNAPELSPAEAIKVQAFGLDEPWTDDEPELGLDFADTTKLPF